jgi:tRNA-2-methylthio-N6-dimethylallyladenosine synthase
VLEAMRRPYTVDTYLERVDQLRVQCPTISLSTDIIVGFPGETDEDFEATMALLDRVRFDSIFAFKYSERPGTRAAKMVDDVPLVVKKARLKRVLDTQHQITEARMAQYQGQTLEVLIEGPSRSTNKGLVDEWQMMGRTRSNVITNVPIPAGDFWTQRWTGRLATITVEEVKAHSLYGRLVCR